MTPFIATFAAIALVAFLHFYRSMRLEFGAAVFAALLTTAVLGLIVAGAVFLGELF